MGSSSPKNVTTTTNSNPPDFLAGPLEDAARWAGTQFNQQMATGVNGEQSSGAQLTGQSQDLLGKTLKGDFLNSNPYLDQTFNRAADLTKGRLDSEFAGSGRNLGASYPARSEELQTLSSNIYGGNYQAERDRQGQALGQAQGYDPLNRFINQLGGVIPGAGGVTSSTQPYFKQGLF